MVFLIEQVSSYLLKLGLLTPGPGSYILPSDFGRLASPTKRYAEVHSG
jgi:hypothetical protein